MSEFLDTLKTLSTAEEFLDFMGVEYDPQVVRVNRLHILKRFHDYIGKAGLPGDLAEADIRPVYASHLAKAYSDFVTSDGVTEKVFKVFEKAAAAKKNAFVPLGEISRKTS
jgi:nitrogenase-stabilizing/protective protein